MRRHPRPVIALLAVAALAGCGPSAESSAPPTVTPTVSASSTTATPTPTPSQADLDKKAAGDTVIAFWKLSDAIAADPKRSVDELDTLSKGELNKAEKSTILGYRAKETRGVGEQITMVKNVDLLDKNMWSVTGCADASKLDLVDHNGKSVVTSTGPNFYSFTDRVERSDDGKMYVVEERNKAVASC